jgi:hypothetical protein
MASKRKRVIVGASLAATVVVALGVGIGSADASTRRPWWDRWKDKPVATAPTKPASPSPSATATTTKPATPSASPTATATATKTATATPTATKTTTAPATGAAYAAPPENATFDYQLGGAYTPPSGVTVVSRDYTASPAAGLYNICYVNAFQTQPDAQSWWEKNHPELLLRDKNGDLVEDEDWGEIMLDFSTEAKQNALTTVVGGWIDQCASKGFKAVEPDNLDTYTRVDGLLTQDQAVAYAAKLSAYAHGKGLAIGQKNTADLSTAKAKKAGFDFAVAEECGQWGECDEYTRTYGNKVLVIEYSQSSFTKVCASHGSKLSIVLRDVAVSAPGSKTYVWKAC